ncbi:M23 family metallopeptidase [Flavobacterium sp. SUN046]|uniref:M23 family metallopeptidase n=1 Tax=Flavobacterium sp. SUN046 TaxID=3002440 RepID=UPI002DBBFE59|nr:M23 family metallopeptidase [Flavobacterium sp. SUN046]MEC4049348.1 M23 family metallopeptidase [Flavobacterium sp. SUN046]
MKFLQLILFFSLASLAQERYPKDYFAPPLEIPIQLSGNFGELRPNHFHAGFDYKTNQKEGLNVYAAADGYVSRIKIATNGYGKAVYITHPNGFTTVYGHLQKGVGSIQDKIISLQYQEHSYDVEAYLKPGELPIKKGELIAISGNTGGSDGPHLHFEIRDSKTEKIINPLLFGIQLKDTKKPIVSNLYVYPIDTTSVVNGYKLPIALNLSLQQDGTYMAEKVSGKGRIGFGINSYDQDDVSYNNNGDYSVQLYSNGSPAFGYKFDEMVFDEARYVNAFIDYERYKKTHQRVQKLFMKRPFNWSNAIVDANDGIISITPNFTRIIKLEVSDFNQNKVFITIPVDYTPNPPIRKEVVKTTNYFVKAKVDANFEKNNVSVFFPAGTFYDDFYLNFDVKDNVLHLHEDIVPAHSNFKISFDKVNASAEELKKMFIATVNEKKLGYLTTKVEGTTLSCRTKTLGQFTIAKDTIAPKISIAKKIEGKWITGQKNIQLTISDDLSGIKSYNGYLNDKWVLFEYEPKTRKITHEFVDEYLNEGENKLKVVVMDNVGNSTIFETQFYRSKK